MSSPSEQRTSTEFPEGYGDLRLVTSDNIIFYFPSFLLMHMSPYFRDLIDSSRPKSSPGESSAPAHPVTLSLQEDSDTIEAVLRLCDPKKDPPRYDRIPSQAALLEAGHKWKIERILQWWEKETDEAASRDYIDPASTKFSPEMALILASRFHSTPRPAQLALRVLITKPYTQMLVEISRQPYPLYQPLFLHLLQLRQQRVKVICEKITRRHNDMKTCSRCAWFGLGLGHAIRDLVLQVGESPSWRTLDAWSFGGCRCEVNNDELNVNEWREEIWHLERDLPALPDDWKDTLWMKSAPGELAEVHSIQAE